MIYNTAFIKIVLKINPMQNLKANLKKVDLLLPFFIFSFK